MYRNYTCRRNYCSCNNNKFEENCQDIAQINNCSCNCMNDSCACGFDEEFNMFPSNPMLGQSYVPIQILDKTFIPKVGLKMGTIFPELVSPYRPNQSVEEIQYIENTNTIKEGCNK